MQPIQKKLKQLLNFVETLEEKIKTHPLRYLLWEPTLRCNLDCLHCSNHAHPNHTQNNELTTQEIKTELYDIAQHYDAKSITFIATGGEPLMREDIIDVGSYAHELGYRWGITTNGIQLSKSKVKVLKEASLGSIAVSLDGLAPHHDQLRNQKGAYVLSQKGIKNLLDKDFSNKLSILTCVNTLNVYNLLPFIEELITQGIKKVRFSPIYQQGRAVEHGSLQLSNQELYDLLLFIKKYRQTFKGVIDISLSDDGYYGATFECHVREHLHYCGAGIEWGAILHDGSVSGSTNIAKKYIQGNIRKESFVSIWENKFHPYREGREASFESYCQGCEEWLLCRGGGFHLLAENPTHQEACAYHKIRSIIDEKNHY